MERALDFKNYEDKLYNVALQCAKLHDVGCSVDCNNCQFNVYHYVKDSRVGSLLRADAFTTYYSRKRVFADASAKSFAHSLTPLFIIAMIAGLIFFACPQKVHANDLFDSFMIEYEAFYQDNINLAALNKMTLMIYYNYTTYNTDCTLKYNDIFILNTSSYIFSVLISNVFFDYCYKNNVDYNSDEYKLVLENIHDTAAAAIDKYSDYIAQANIKSNTSLNYIQPESIRLMFYTLTASIVAENTVKVRQPVPPMTKAQPVPPKQVYRTGRKINSQSIGTGGIRLGQEADFGELNEY